MIKLLKVITSLIIILCVFMPVSQCTLKSKPNISESGEVLKQSEDVIEKYVIFNAISENENSITFADLVFICAFFVPLVLALLSNFSGWKRITKLVIQSTLSGWLVYCSYMLVFGFLSPLPAGWALCTACILFLILTSLEWLSIKHNKFKNENASAAGTGVASTRRPF